MASKISKWVNDRIPIAVIKQIGLEERIPGGASFFFTLGSATLFLFILQVVTGIWQLFYYVPTIDHAYDSLTYLRSNVPYGWLIHGLHYWGASAMIVLVGLHILRVFIWGAYKKPRELTWLFGFLLLLLTVGMSFTGAALPWDERGYWATEVGTSIAGTVPFIGNGIKYLLLGGQKIGQLTLSRFFVLHTAIIPGLVIIAIAAHLIAFRKFGSVGPWSESKRSTVGDFWPDQVAKDIIVVVLIFLILNILSVFAPPPFMGPADSLDTMFTPKPEWNFLFLYQTLKFFPGKLEVIGTVGIPILIVLLFISLPFLDRSPERNPLKRPVIMLCGLIFVVLLLTLTITGYNSKITTVQTKANLPVKQVMNTSTSVLKGKELFNTSGCIACHTMNGNGGKIGPDLTNESQSGHTKQWIITQLTDLKKHYPKSIMPAFSTLNNTQLNQLADYLLSTHLGSITSGNNSDTVKSTKSGQNIQSTGKPAAVVDTTKSITNATKNSEVTGAAANMIGNVALGSLLFQQDCQSCHGVDGKGGVPNPGSRSGHVPPLNPIDRKLYNTNPQIFADNIDKIIQHGSIPPGKNPTLHMLDFGDSYSLTQQEIASLEAYILDLNGVNRAKLITTSSNPEQYFTIIVSVFLGLSLILFILYLLSRKNVKRFKKVP